jgi:biotin carboxylase
MNPRAKGGSNRKKPDLSGKWVLVLGAGYWQIPLIRTVRRLGFKPVAIDRDPSAPGAPEADRFEPINIVDSEGAIKLGRELDIVGAVSDQTDLAVPALARICSELNLPGPSPETAYNTTNKGRMRELASQAGLINPRYRICSSVDEALDSIDLETRAAPGGVGLPCVVKPTDAQASRGVLRIEKRKDLQPACEEAFGFSREGRILVEEYLVGTEVTVEGCRYAGETHLLAVSAKKHTPPPHIIAVNLDFPAPFPPEIHEEIHRVYVALVDALGITAGSIHGELMVTDHGIFLVEMANRGGGSGTSSHVVPALSGVDLLEANVLYATGRERPVKRTRSRSGVLRFMIFPPGKVTEISGLEQARSLEGVVACDLYIRPGDLLTPPTMDTHRHGYIITVADSLEHAQRIADEVEKTVRVITSRAI